MTLPPDGEPPELDADLEPELGELPPDPDERPPVELWSSVGDIPPWGTMLLVLAWAGVFLITVGVLALNILARVMFRNKH